MSNNTLLIDLLMDVVSQGYKVGGHATVDGDPFEGCDFARVQSRGIRNHKGTKKERIGGKQCQQHNYQKRNRQESGHTYASRR